MSNFLSQLLARSTGNAEVAKPRRAARFEPQSLDVPSVPDTSAAAPYVEEVNETEQTTERGPSEANVESLKPANEPQPTLTLRPISALDQKHADLYSSGVQASTAEGDKVARVQEEQKSSTKENTALFDDARRATLQDHQSAFSAPPHAPSLQISEVTLVSSEDLGKPRAISPARQVAEDKALEDTMPPTNSSGSLILPKLANNSIAKENPSDQSPSFASPRALAPSHPKTWEPQETRTPSTDSEPAIHITIGRVEVRATIAEKTKRSAKPESAVMGLDEYLRKQRRGASQ